MFAEGQWSVSLLDSWNVRCTSVMLPLWDVCFTYTTVRGFLPWCVWLFARGCAEKGKEGWNPCKIRRRGWRRKVCMTVSVSVRAFVRARESCVIKLTRRAVFLYSYYVFYTNKLSWKTVRSRMTRKKSNRMARQTGKRWPRYCKDTCTSTRLNIDLHD